MRKFRIPKIRIPDKVKEEIEKIEHPIPPELPPEEVPEEPGEPGIEYPLNIDTATKEELDTLPGIGPTYAQRIIDYRIEHGNYEYKDDIKNVEGIGETTYQKIKDLIITTAHGSEERPIEPEPPEEEVGDLRLRFLIEGHYRASTFVIKRPDNSIYAQKSDTWSWTVEDVPVDTYTIEATTSYGDGYTATKQVTVVANQLTGVILAPEQPPEP